MIHTGLSGDHLFGDLLHAIELGNVQFQNIFLDRMGDDKTLTVDHKGIPGLTHLCVGDEIAEKTNVDDIGNHSDDPAVRIYGSSDGHERFPGYLVEAGLAYVCLS